MSESPGPRASTQPAPSTTLEARATSEERLRAVSPAVGWGPWLEALLRDLLVAGVRAGSIDADVAKKAAEHFVASRPHAGFLATVEFVHDLSFRFPELDSTLRPVRARVIEYVEPLVSERAVAAIRDGRHEAATATVQGFLQLATRYADGHVEPTLLTNALQRLVNGGPQ